MAKVASFWGVENNFLAKFRKTAKKPYLCIAK